MSDSLKRSIINLITKKTKKSSNDEVNQTLFSDIKKKLRRTKSVGKAVWFLSDDKSIIASKTTRNSSVNFSRRDVEISKFYDICNIGSQNSHSLLGSMSDISELSKELIIVPAIEEIITKKTPNKTVKSATK